VTRVASRRHRWLAAWTATAGCALFAPGTALAAPPSGCPPQARIPDDAELHAAERDAVDHGFLWRFEKDGRSGALYGTLHVGRIGWLAPGPRVRAELAQSDTLALELDLLDDAVRGPLAAGLAAGDDDALPDDLRDRLARSAAADCLQPEPLARLAPEMQVATLTSLVGRRDRLDPAYGVDMALAARSRVERRRIVSLETPALQIAVLKAHDAAARASLVRDGLDEIDSGHARSQMLELAAVWADGDLDKLARYDTWCGCVHGEADRRTLAAMIDGRNPALAAAIDALHATGHRVFAAVGSLHMVGPGGLPARLEARGYRVVRVALTD
jgi:uncharacterized protein